MSRSYWRSLGQLEDSPEYRAFLEREFPEGASEAPDAVTRREMMLLLGASLSMATLAGCRRPVDVIVPYANPPEEIIPGIPRHYATTMPFGRSAYGLVVESHEGRPTKVEGNALHPATLGASSARVQAAILGLYDPDRSQSVLHAGAAKSWTEFTGAWAELEKTHLADGGAGLAILSGSSCSPTLARLTAQLRARFPRARFVAYESVSDENVLAGIRAATGRELEPVLRLEHAAVLLTLDADLLLTDPESIRHTRGFAAGRKAGTEGGTMSRHWAVEAVYSLTGAAADHRLRISARQVPAVLAALAAKLAALGAGDFHVPSPDLPPGINPIWLDALARDLVANRGKGLIVAGRRQSAAVHGAVLALNTALGNVGQTVVYREVKDAALSSREALAGLVTAMNAGSVGTLVMLGVNPVYDAPADLDFATALGKVQNSIALATHVDETSRKSAWHLPRAHFLESWGDARSACGTASVVQPLILPLYGGHSDAELLALLAGGKDQPGYDVVRETWKGVLGEADFEKRWRRVLHDGVLAGSEIAPLSALPLAATPAQLVGALVSLPPAADALEVVFEPSAYLHDGRFANDGWLQELPDPITKVTWDNPVLVSPATALKLGVANEDVVRLEAQGRKIEGPVWLVPGQADGTVVLTLGYGRASAGRVGTGVGIDAGRLRTMSASDVATGISLVKTGSAQPLATTQEHGSMEARPLVREASVREYKKNPAFAAEAVEQEGESSQLFPEPSRYDTGHQWAMTIDLNACVGCNACAVACQSENNVPVVGKDQVRRGREMAWIRVDRYFSGEPQGDPEVVFQPVPCMQCENAPCEQVCPVAATVHDAEGLNVMVYNRCIGTRYCSNNCPYKVRRFNFYNFTKDTPESLKLLQNPDVTVRARGVMEKCTYCVQRINAVKLDSKLKGHELVDGDIQTACQQACPAGAITFGDLRDPGSRVVKQKADPRNYALLEELRTKPRTTYLAKVRNPHPDLET